MKIVSLICFIYCVLENASGAQEKDEGSACEKLGVVGFCRRVSDCSPAIEALKKRRPHDLDRCGFIGKEEVVCCPDLSPRGPTFVESSTLDKLLVWSEGNGVDPNSKNPVENKGRVNGKRKSEIMCEKIYKDNNIKPEISFNIYNGEDATIGQFPHVGALGFLDKNGDIDWKKCAGSLISTRFLLTAAHCFICSDCEDPVKVRFGVVDIRDDQAAQDIDVKRTILFEGYSITSKHNDLALIELSSDVRTTKTIYPACLFTEPDDPPGLLISGWGITDPSNPNSRSDILQFAPTKAVPVNTCNVTQARQDIVTKKTIINSQICAISDKLSDTCPGDSGGPLQTQSLQGGFKIVGVVSYGTRCGTKNPGIYTRVASYLDWIEDNVWPT